MQSSPLSCFAFFALLPFFTFFLARFEPVHAGSRCELRAELESESEPDRLTEEGPECGRGVS